MYRSAVLVGTTQKSQPIRIDGIVSLQGNPESHSPFLKLPTIMLVNSPIASFMSASLNAAASSWETPSMLPTHCFANGSSKYT